MMWMADKYGMKKLLKISIQNIGSLENAKNLKNSTLFASLSHNAKVMVLEQLLKFI